ncbi:unnamed protein product [Closterium sp. NIES-64]|nr:unnamed protein product [Closterium sp. NIES-64]
MAGAAGAVEERGGSSATGCAAASGAGSRTGWQERWAGVIARGVIVSGMTVSGVIVSGVIVSGVIVGGLEGVVCMCCAEATAAALPCRCCSEWRRQQNGLAGTLGSGWCDSGWCDSVWGDSMWNGRGYSAIHVQRQQQQPCIQVLQRVAQAGKQQNVPTGTQGGCGWGGVM